MSNKALKLLTIAAFFIAATVAAYANPVEAGFAGLGGQTQNGEYTYPYFITIDNGAQIAMMCDDFTHQSSIGDNWLANITALNSGDLSHTRFDNVTEYEQAGYLLMQVNGSNQA